MIASLVSLMLAAAPVPPATSSNEPASAPRAVDVVGTPIIRVTPGQVLHEQQLTPVTESTGPADAPATVTNFELKPIPNSPPEAVRIAITQDQPAGAAGPGFLIAIRGWTPFGRITAVLIGANRKRVEVVPSDRAMELGADGNATLLVPYSLAGLSPGTWKLAVGGASGNHVLDVQIPAVLPADATHATYRLVFGAPSRAKATSGAAKRPVAKPRSDH